MIRRKISIFTCGMLLVSMLSVSGVVMGQPLDCPNYSVKEEIKKQPVKEELKKKPVKEEVKKDPVKEELKKKPVKEEVKKQPVKEEVKEKPTYSSEENAPIVLTAGQNANNKPCYWIGEKRVDLELPEGRMGRAKSIIEWNGKIYTIGEYYENYDIKPCYWVGTKMVDLSLPEGCATGSVSKIMTSENKLIITGMYKNLNGNLNVCYWSGDKRVDCDTGLTNYDLMQVSVFYNDGELYTTGELESDKEGFGIYLVGNKIVYLPVTKELAYGSVSVSVLAFYNSKVYAGGEYVARSPDGGPNIGHACYWEDGKFVNIPVPDYAFQTVGSDIDFYEGKVCISVGPFPFYWDGNKLIEITNGEIPTYSAGSLDVYNGEIYTTGYTGIGWGIPCYWMGTERTDLEIDRSTTGDYNSSSIYDIFVTSKANIKE